MAIDSRDSDDFLVAGGTVGTPADSSRGCEGAFLVEAPGQVLPLLRGEGQFFLP